METGTGSGDAAGDATDGPGEGVRSATTDPWALGPPGVSGSTSPYGRSAFDVLDLPIEPLPRAEALIRVRRRVNRARAGTVRLGDRPVAEPDVRAAAQRLERPADRIAERLLVHRPHPARIDVTDLRERLGAVPSEPVPDGLPLLDRSCFAALVETETRDGDDR